MNWSRHMMLTISAALLVVVAVTAAWAVESGFGTRADARSLPVVALGSATTGTAPGSSSAPKITGTANARLVVAQSLRMSPGPIESGASAAGGTMMTSPPTTGTQGTPGTTMSTGAGRGDMSTGSAGTGMGSGSTATTMDTQSTTGTTAHRGSEGMVGTTPTTSAQSSMPMTTATSPPTITHIGGGMGGTTGGGGTTGDSGMGGTITR